MIITGLGGAKAADSTQKKKAKTNAGGTDFASLLEAEDTANVSENAPVSDLGGVSSLTSFLNLQQPVSEEDGNKPAKRKGETLLKQLDALRHTIVSGAVPSIVLEEITKTLERPLSLPADPKLQNILEEIELRAKVELAKREVAE